ncbi:GGDEF domain-containing protein [Thermoleophilia bacterium SCSIO 60948]|nr:GGDEF domain-containing protein [Thermoleophilia bacterium SCSIO 60948]
MAPSTATAPRSGSVRPAQGFAAIASRVLEVLEQQLPGSLFYVSQFDRETDELRYVDARGGEAIGIAAGESITLSESFCVRMADGGAPNLANRTQEDSPYAELEIASIVGSYLGVALRSDDGPAIGSLCAVADERDAFSESDLELISLLGRLLERELEREAVLQGPVLVETALREAASTDALTGVGNRRRLEVALAHELGEVATDRRRTATLMLIDLDRLKPINDTYGHRAGDAVLRAFGQALHRTARETDVVARIGGDEFAALLRGASVDTPCVDFAARLEESLREAGPEGGPIEFSWGCSSLRDHTLPAGVLDEADARMYEHKRSRRRAGARD